MKTNDFVCSALGIYGGVIDRICDNFDIDYSYDDVYEAINCQKFVDDTNAWNIGRFLLIRLLENIKVRFKDELDEDKFDYDVDSPGYPIFYYDGDKINSIDDLYRIVELKYSE